MKTTWMLLILFVGTCAHGEERIEFYNGIRQMGMGGVATPTVNDETSLLLNPAGLGRLRASIFTIVDPELSASNNDLSILTKNGGSDTTAVSEPQKLLDRLNLSPDKHFHSLGQMFPSFVTTNFGIGVYGKNLVNGEVVSEPAPAQFKYLNQTDYALVLGVNFRFWDGRIKLGLGGRVINRTEAKTQLPATTTGLLLKDIIKEGVGIGGDVGLILTAPWAWLPSLAGVWRDAGTTSFDQNDGLLNKTADRPDSIKTTADVGVSVSPILGRSLRAQFGAEYRDVMTYNDEADQMRRVHLGLELNYADMLFLRGGMNQRYWTAGLEFAMAFFQLQVASYGEEIGTKDDPREDRRYMGKFALRF